MKTEYEVSFLKQTIARSLVLVMLVFAVIAGKFAYIQLIQADSLQKETVEQRVRTIKELPERGQIVDSEGRILAMSLNAKDIAVYPNIIGSDEKRKELAKLLSEKLELQYEDVLKLVSQKNENGSYAQWVSVARRVSPEIAQELKTSKFTSYIEISNAPKRYYPNGSLASTILGFVNYESQPGAGVEMSLNNYLGGISGYTIAEFDNTKKEIPIGLQTASKPVSGQKVTLTIDSYIQYALEEAIADAAEEMDPKGIHAAVMDPNTGKILAMASYPFFDPNDYSNADLSVINTNISSLVYEPGSTFKPVYMMGALDAGYIDKDFSYYDGGNINVHGSTLWNWDKQGLGQANLEDIIVNSSNVGMVTISQQMTAAQTVSVLEKAGFGKKTGVELPNEEIGLVPSEDTLKNDPTVKATVAFGQGISITPIQLLTSFSEVINGGYELTPTLVEKVEDEYGNIQYEWTEEKVRKYKKESSDIMKSHLKANMEIGSGKNLQISGYDGGGKTGSAWKVENGRYKEGAIIGSFIGFAPYENPEYVVLAIVDEPQNTDLFGSATAGPIFQQTMQEILRYSGTEKTVPVDGEKDVQKNVEITVPDVKYELYDNAKEMIESSVDEKVVVKKEGKGEVVVSQDYSYNNGKFTVVLKTVNLKGTGATYMPNVIGMTLDEVTTLFRKYNIDVEVKGSGIVIEQSISEGKYKKPVKEIELWLE